MITKLIELIELIHGEINSKPVGADEREFMMKCKETKISIGLFVCAGTV
jgi:hypothetical protein